MISSMASCVACQANRLLRLVCVFYRNNLLIGRTWVWSRRSYSPYIQLVQSRVPEMQSTVPLRAVSRRRGRNILERPGVIRAESMNREQLVKHLLEQIIYDEGGIIALNKPAGLGVQSQRADSDTDDQQWNILDLLTDFKQHLGEEHLHFVKAPEKECSGVTLLAKTPQIAAEIDQTLRKARLRQVYTRTFWAVTVGIPSPVSGIIDIPLGDEVIRNERQVVPKRNAAKRSFKTGETKKLITSYRVISQNNNCALVELKPMKSYKHQLRVHMTTKLCSILGDHVYSSRVQTILGIPVLIDGHNAVPGTQVICEDIRHKMNLSAKAIHDVPLHLHCVAITLPKWKNKKDLIIAAPLPKYFWKTLKLLDIEHSTVSSELFAVHKR